VEILRQHEVRYIKNRTPKPKLFSVKENRAYQVRADKWPNLNVVKVSTIIEGDADFAVSPTKQKEEENLFSLSWKHEIK
jgi:hypothetical protein